MALAACPWARTALSAVARHSANCPRAACHNHQNHPSSLAPINGALGNDRTVIRPNPTKMSNFFSDESSASQPLCLWQQPQRGGISCPLTLANIGFL
ncbi:hypothetical protein BHM03_00034864 [Ensete ventricosum]|nr:hypothetical protein BHM03_00034864 [Ensete ventricosum]